MAEQSSDPISDVIVRMTEQLDGLAPTDARRHFHATYLRTTVAVADEVRRGGFSDPVWLQRWDESFARLYLDAFDAWECDRAPGAWQVPFAAARDRPDLAVVQHVLFGMNVHINFDLPQSLIAVISDDEFDDPRIRALRQGDHDAIDEVLLQRIAAEDRLLPDRSFVDRVLSPVNRIATRRFLHEARAKVWRNAVVLSAARRSGGDALARAIEQLDGLCADRVADLTAPGPVVLRLARKGFGVLLPGALNGQTVSPARRRGRR